MRLALLGLIALSLAQCVPTRHVNVAYQPSLRNAKEVDPKLLPVTVRVVDKRTTQVVGHPIGAFGEKEGEILSEGDVPSNLQKAFEIELRNEGLSIGAGGNNVILTVSFFQSQYLHPLFHTRAVASLGMEVAVKRRNGTLVYDNFVVGQAEHDAETHSDSSPTWASYVLNEATQNAIAKTIADPAFLDALKTRSGPS